MRPLIHGAVVSVLQAVQVSNSRPVVQLAFEFLALTAMRSGEVRRAAWAQTCRDEGVWSVTPRRTKDNREHRAPLSRLRRIIRAK